METLTDIAQDGRLVELKSLAPLDVGKWLDDAELLALAAEHNARTAQAVARLRQLVADRERLTQINE